MEKLHPRSSFDGLRFLHLTDTHLLDDPNEKLRNINTRNSFEATLLQAIECHPDCDFVLLTGDISNTGSERSYQNFCSVIEGIHVPFYCVPGNHDNPLHLQEVIPTSPHNSVHAVRIGKFTLLLLSSWVNGKESGEISGQSWQHLEKWLQECKTENLIVAIHHPPIPMQSAWLDNLGLSNGKKLLARLHQCSGNIVLIFGHVHQEMDVSMKNVHLLATPSTCYQFKPHSHAMKFEEISKPGYRYIEWSGAKTLYSKLEYVEMP